MTFLTLTDLNHPLWEQARRIYDDAFPPHGRKPETLIQSMLERGLAQVHLLTMEAAGPGGGGRVQIVDYLAVAAVVQGQGIGTRMIDELSGWSRQHTKASALLVEAESEPTAENRRRFQFWERAGFCATGYIHQYIWVPEPYRALYLPLTANASLPPGQEELFHEGDGRQLFRWISEFHRRSYMGFKEADE